MGLRSVVAAMAVVVAGGVGGGVWSQPAGAQDGGLSLGGGSDISAGTVLSLPPGGGIGAIHHLTADNPTDQPLQVDFRAESPLGIQVVPSLERATIAPGRSVRVPFALEVAASMTAGDHVVNVQLVRSDVPATPGVVTSVPAVGTTFTVRVTGSTGTLVVRAVSAETGAPADGTISIHAVDASDRTLEVARVEDSELSQVVAPGVYRASYRLGGTEMASQRVTVAEGGSATATLAVRSVSFVAGSARAGRQHGAVVVADLTASVENRVGPIEGEVALVARIRHDDGPPEVATLQRFDGLPTGLTETTVTWHPADGFEPGTYRFEFQLVTSAFTISHAGQAEVVVPEPPASRSPALVTGAAVLGGMVTYFLTTAVSRRRSARSDRRHAAPVHEPVAVATEAPVHVVPDQAAADSPHPAAWPWRLEGNTWTCNWSE